MLGFWRGNTMPRRNAPRQLLTIFLKVQFGGEGGIRTLETREGLTVFKTVPFDRSGTSPKVCPYCRDEALFRQPKTPFLYLLIPALVLGYKYQATPSQKQTLHGYTPR